MSKKSCHTIKDLLRIPIEASSVKIGEPLSCKKAYPGLTVGKDYIVVSIRKRASLGTVIVKNDSGDHAGYPLDTFNLK